MGELAAGRLLGILGNGVEGLGDPVSAAQGGGDQLEHIGQLVGERRLALDLVATHPEPCPERDDDRHRHGEERPTEQESDEPGDEGDHRHRGDELGRLHRDVGHRQIGGQLRPLAAALEGFVHGRHGALPHFRDATRLVDAQPGLGHSPPGKEQQSDDEQAGEDAQPAEPQHHRRAVVGRRRRAGAGGRTEIVGDAALGGAAGAAVVGAAVAGAAVGGAAVGGAAGTVAASVSRAATRANAADTPAASSAGVTDPSAKRLVRSVSSVVRLIASTYLPCTAARASSSVAVLPSSLPSDSSTSTFCSASGENDWLATTTASYSAVSPSATIPPISPASRAWSVVGGVSTVTTSPKVSRPMRTSSGMAATNSPAAVLAASIAVRMLPEVSTTSITSSSSAGTWASAGAPKRSPASPATIGTRNVRRFIAATRLRRRTAHPAR